MSKHNTLSDDFTQGSIVGKLVKFMVPVLGALILQAMYGAVWNRCGYLGGGDGEQHH